MITPAQLERILKIPPPGPNALVPLSLLPAYLEYHKIYAVPNYKIPVNKPIEIRTKKSIQGEQWAIQPK